MERKDYLVYIKENNGGFSTETTRFEPHNHYRCMELVDGDNSEMLVNGEVFTKEAFEDLFEYSHKRILRHFEALGLVHVSTGGGIKPVSKKQFIERGYAVKYGKGNGSFWTLYTYTHPKELMYRFSPNMGSGKKATDMTNMYNAFLDVVNGNTEAIDNNEIEFGNCGLPLGAYRELSKRFLSYLNV